VSHLDAVVARYAKLFDGSVPRETTARLDNVEKELSVILPVDLKDLLLRYGYGSTAVPNISTAVKDTRRFRSAVDLPDRYVVLDDMNDGGVVLLDTQSADGPVLWVDSHAVGKLRSNNLSQSEHDLFPSFVSWLERCLDNDEQFRAT